MVVNKEAVKLKAQLKNVLQIENLDKSIINGALENINIQSLIDLFLQKDKIADDFLKVTLKTTFNKKLAQALWEQAQENSSLELETTALNRRVAEWIRSFSPPDTDLALMLLASKDISVQNIASFWILVSLPFEEKILHAMFKSENSKVIQRAKKWFQRNKGILDRYLIRKEGKNINISHEGQSVDITEFPLQIITEILKIPYDVVLQVRKFIFDIDKGTQIVVEDLNKLSDNNVQQLCANIEKRMGLLDVLADSMSWNNIDSNIVSYKIFHKYIGE